MTPLDQYEGCLSMLVISSCHASSLPLGDHSVWPCWVFLYVALVKHPSIFLVFTILGHWLGHWRLFRARRCFLDISESWWGTDLLLPSLTVFCFWLRCSYFTLWLGTKVEIRTRRCILVSHGLRGSDRARWSTFAHSCRNLVILWTLLQLLRRHASSGLGVVLWILLQRLFLYVFLYKVLVRLSGWCSAAVERGTGLHANCRI